MQCSISTGYNTDANGYFVLGNPGVPEAGLTFHPGQFGLLQNGPDAVALYVGNASDFPIGTVVDHDEPAGRSRLRHRRSDARA